MPPGTDAVVFTNRMAAIDALGAAFRDHFVGVVAIGRMPAD
jgi:hypothetical protein